MVTGAEAVEAALPSADPASGPHPHAPSAPHADHATANGGVPDASGAAEGGPALSPRRRAALRAGVNRRYSGAVEAGEVEEMHALLGSEHIFKCLTV